MLISLNKLSALYREESGRIITDALQHIDNPFLTEERTFNRLAGWGDMDNPDDLDKHFWREIGEGIDSWIDWCRVLRYKAENPSAPDLSLADATTYDVTAEQVHQDWGTLMGHLLERVDELLAVDLTPATSPTNPDRQEDLLDLGTIVQRNESRLTLARTMRDTAIRESDAYGVPATRIAEWAGVHRNIIHRTLKK